MKFRSKQKEYLDDAVIETKDLFRNLFELDVINAQLGGYKASINGLKEILKTNKQVNTIMDIGFGGGDFIKQFSNFSNENRLKFFFYGVDLKADCVAYAEKNLVLVHGKQLICSDYKNISKELLQKVDVIHCSLFLHHLNDEEIIDLFKFAKTNHCILLANDLHRNWFAYYSIKILTFLFSRSYLVKNDAPLSVKRGFKKEELISLLSQAGITDHSVKWSWAFRYIIIANP